MSQLRLPIESILSTDRRDLPKAQILGRSRQGRDISGYRLGHGPSHVSLIGGCHADEPVGPEMLEKLVAWLVAQDSDSPALAELTWLIVPHVNPDGRVRNTVWRRTLVPTIDHEGVSDQGYDVVAYSREAVRELPGDDIEFGFPRSFDDRDARPENRAVAGFLERAAPIHLHGSFHGMGFATGPWFLIEPTWIERTAALREALRHRVGAMGYRPFDVDRRGEKGFRRIDEGFSTRPDSKAMQAHFEESGDPDTASLFRPSSMEYVRSLGNDPFTLVSEMPLFLLPDEDEALADAPPFGTGSEGRKNLHSWLQQLIASRGTDAARIQIEGLGIRPMPLRDQMRLQLAFLDEALQMVLGT
ncbi:MAG: M14 family zinc carboxypeptidase [Thermoanaerobaculia bacterium]